LKKSIRLFFLICIVFASSCQKDDSSLQSCVSCNSPQTTIFEVCKNSNGNATVNGENTGTEFDAYIDALEQAGAACGG